MPSVCQDRLILHGQHMFHRDSMFASGRRNKHIAQRSCLCHSHHVIPVHFSFHRLYRIYFRYDDLCTEGCRTHGNTSAAPAVADYNDCFGCHDQVCITHDAVPYGLSRSVSIIEQVLTLGIVYSNHREFQNAVFLHRFKANDTGSGFFAPTQYGFSQIRTLAVDHLHQVSSVVDYDMRLMFQAHFDVPHIFFIRCPMIGEYCKAFICQCSRHIILGRKTVAARYRHLCAACSQHQAKICRLGFQVHRKADTQSLKGFCGTEFLFQTGQQRHIVLDPLDLSVSGRCQGNVSDIVLIVHILFLQKSRNRLTARPVCFSMLS